MMAALHIQESGCWMKCLMWWDTPKMEVFSQKYLRIHRVFIMTFHAFIKHCLSFVHRSKLHCKKIHFRMAALWTWLERDVRWRCVVWDGDFIVLCGMSDVWVCVCQHQTQKQACVNTGATSSTVARFANFSASASSASISNWLRDLPAIMRVRERAWQGGG